MTQASPQNCQAGTFSPVTTPIGPAPSSPESGGGTKWAGASHWVPVCSSITSMSRCRPVRPNVAVGTIASGVIPTGHTQGRSGETVSDRSATAGGEPGSAAWHVAVHKTAMPIQPCLNAPRDMARGCGVITDSLTLRRKNHAGRRVH